jgi:CBS domain-containing protein
MICIKPFDQLWAHFASLRTQATLMSVNPPLQVDQRAKQMSMYRFLECTVGPYMTRDVIVVTPDVTLRDLEALFAARDFNAFPVVERDRVVGVATKFDFLNAFVFTTQQMVPHYDELMSGTVRGIMTKEVIDVQPDSP